MSLMARGRRQSVKETGLTVPTERLVKRSGSISEIRQDRLITKQLTLTDTIGRRKSDAKQPLSIFKEAPFLLQIHGIPLGAAENTPFEFSAKEFARQLTLMAAAFFRKIPRKEFESIQWTSSRKQHVTPTIVKMTLHFNMVYIINKLSLWIAQQILDASKIKIRMQLITFFIHAAQALLEFDNFDTLKSIVSALQSTPVFRLSRTWALVGRKERDIFQKLSDLTSIDNNNEKYRKLVNACKPPFIPYLGIFLSDLTYVYECLKKDKDNPDRKPQYKERSKQFEQMLDDISRIQQNCLYHFPGDMLGQAAIEYQYSMGTTDVNVWTDMQYQQSYTIEPRDGSLAPKEENEWKFGSLRIYRASKSSIKNVLNPTEKQSMSIPSRGSSSMDFGSPSSPLSPRRKQRPKLDNVFASTEQVQTTELPTGEEKIVQLESPKKSKLFGGFMNPFRRRLSMSKDRELASQQSISSFEGSADEIPATYQPMIPKHANKPAKIQTKLAKEGVESNLSPVPWEAKKTLHLHAIMQKKEEFDEEGIKSKEKNWVETKIELESSKLTFSTPMLKTKSPSTTKSNLLLSSPTKEPSEMNEDKKPKLLRSGSGGGTATHKNGLQKSASLSNILADFKPQKKQSPTISPFTPLPVLHLNTDGIIYP